MWYFEAMIWKFRYIVLATAVLAACAFQSNGSEVWADSSSAVIIDFFFETGCRDCQQVKEEVLPRLKERLEGLYTLNSFDVGQPSNVVRLIAYQEQLGITENRPVCMVVDYKYALNGFEDISTGLIDRVDECISERQEPDWAALKPIQTSKPNDTSLAAERLGRFTLSAVLVAGLLDGINPCAISTLVFMMSLLALAKARGSNVVMLGVFYCLASFITYTALGFGILKTLRIFAGFQALKSAVDVVMIVALAILSFLSFRDAHRYGKSGSPQDVTLQLPDGIKHRIHRIMREGIGKGSLIAGGLLMGTLVTLLESVCTGQVYLPTLVLAIRAGASASQAWTYLLLYNAMFIVPLVTVFLLVHFGLGMETLLAWSRKNVVLSKVLIGSLFLAMAVLLLLM